jgi:GGDEF domain-containing protein
MQPPVLLMTAGHCLAVDRHRHVPEHGDSMDALIRCADTAMYQAKQAGGNRHVFWSAA